MNKKKRMTVLLVTLLIPFILVACSNTSSENTTGSNNDPDAMFKIAWQYIVYQINNSSYTGQINGAKITRLELVDTYQSAAGEAVNIYSLEYNFFINKEEGWVPGSTGFGSPYLFVVNKDGSPQIIGVEYTKDVLASGGYGKIAEEVIANDEILDFAKYSSDAAPYSQDEIEAAFNAVKNHYTMTDQLLINLWYDKEKCLAQVDEYSKTSTLYGMAEAAARGDLLFLYSDIYSLNPDFEQLMMEMNIILIRDSEDAPWEIVDQGY